MEDSQARAAIQPRVAFYAIRYILALILPNDRVKNMPLQKSIFWASGSATKQFQKIDFFLTFVLFLIVLASFTNKNMISRPVHATMHHGRRYAIRYILASRAHELDLPFGLDLGSSNQTKSKSPTLEYF